MTLEQLITGGVFSFLFLFARVGSAIMILPLLGDGFVPGIMRVLFALGFCVVLTPWLAASVPQVPEAPAALLLVLFSEIVVGVFVGLISRFLLSALDTAGTVIAFQSGLSNAFVFNPSQFGQSPITATFLTLVGALLLFVTNLHHMLIMAIIRSYELFPAAALPPSGDLAAVMSRFLSDAFSLGVQVAAPIILVGLILLVGTGLVNRLMPQVQVFFIILPVQVGLGLSVFAMTASAMLLFWLARFEQHYIGFLQGTTY